MPLYTISTDHPFPGVKKRRGAPARYPWSRMEIGDSFKFYPSEAPSVEACLRQANRDGGRRFIIAGTRCWRIK